MKGLWRADRTCRDPPTTTGPPPPSPTLSPAAFCVSICSFLSKASNIYFALTLSMCVYVTCMCAFFWYYYTHVGAFSLCMYVYVYVWASVCTCVYTYVCYEWLRTHTSYFRTHTHTWFCVHSNEIKTIHNWPSREKSILGYLWIWPFILLPSNMITFDLE